MAQAFGVDLHMVDYLTIISIATLASIGTAGTPGTGLMLLTLTLTAVGLPLEGVALIAGIDRILDMARTTVNVSGDILVSVLIARSERELDLATYHDASAGETSTSPCAEAGRAINFRGDRGGSASKHRSWRRSPPRIGRTASRCPGAADSAR